MKKITAADKIYRAAKHLFYENGYYGTTTRDITSKSKTNLGLIKYYFDSKKVLAYNMLKEIVSEASSSIDNHLNQLEDPLLYAMTYTNVFLNLIFNDEQVEKFIVEAFSDEIMEDLDEAFYRSNLYTLNLLILEKHQFSPDLGAHQTIQLNFYSYHNTIKSLGRMRLKGKLVLTDDQFRSYVLKTTYFGLGVNVDDEKERMEKAFLLSQEIENENIRIKEPKRIFMNA